MSEELKINLLISNGEDCAADWDFVDLSGYRFEAAFHAAHQEIQKRVGFVDTIEDLEEDVTETQIEKTYSFFEVETRQELAVLVVTVDRPQVCVYWDDCSNPQSPGWVWEYGTRCRAIPGQEGRDPSIDIDDLGGLARTDPFFPEFGNVTVERKEVANV